MNFPLKNLELHIPEASLLVGERLMEEEKVLKLNELERNLWVAEVEDNEVEVQITPGKVRAATCECKVFKNKEMCGHLAAVLFKLRRIVSERKEVQQTRRLQKSLPRKLTTASIIENITEEELIGFVKSYAKSNREFSLALKARFAANVPMLDSRQKYIQLIESTISTHRLKNDLVSFRGFQQLKKLAQELLGQSDDAFALENYSEGVTIVQCLIERITPIIQKVKGDGSPLNDFIVGGFMRIERLLNLNLAPDLKENIWNFCLTECTKLTYQTNHFAFYFYQILQRLCDKPTKILLLRQVVDTELLKRDLTNNLKANLLFVKLNLLEKEKKKKEAEEFIKKHVSNPEFALFVVQKTLQEKDFKKAKQFAENALLKSVPKTIKEDLEEAMFQIHLLTKDAPKIVEFGKKRLLTTQNFSYFKAIKENHKNDWEKQYESILKSIKILPFSKEKRDLLAEIYVEEDRLDELLNYIERFQSLELLHGFDKYLLPNYKEKVHSLYHLFLNNFLENHIGKKPTAKVQKSLNHLLEIGERKFAHELIADFRVRYSGRHALMNTLMRV